MEKRRLLENAFFSTVHMTFVEMIFVDLLSAFDFLVHKVSQTVGLGKANIDASHLEL